MEMDNVIYNEDDVEIIDRKEKEETKKERKTYTPMEAAKIIDVSKTTIHTYINEFKECLEGHIEKNELGHNFLDEDAINMIRDISYMRKELHLTNEEVKAQIGSEGYVIMAQTSADDRLKKYIELRDIKLDEQFKKLATELSEGLKAQTEIITENVSIRIDKEARKMITELQEKNAKLEEENNKLQSQLTQHEVEKVKLEYETKIRIMQEELDEKRKETEKKKFSFFRRN